MAETADLLMLDGCVMRDRLASGAIKALELVEASIARIEAREPDVKAWAWFDPDFARHQARALDAHRQAGRAIGPLHGLPVALKDVIDTAKIPTENGCSLDEGRVPIMDAAVAGTPCVVLSIGTDREGLPIGVQVHARRWADERLLDVAATLERVLGENGAPVDVPV